MSQILETGCQGTIKLYAETEGWGFIERANQPDVFFHAKSLSCTPPYKGECVVFDIARSASPKYEFEAANVRRAGGGRLTGDILEWQVEPGSWKTKGIIAAHEGGPLIHFTATDLSIAPAAGGPKPRPWHAASFSVAQTPSGPRAVDIDIDIRYPLQRFAYLGLEEDMIRSLKEMALPEDWNFTRSTTTKEAPILYSYLQFTFAKLCDEDRGQHVQKRKIRVRTDAPQLAAFNTGLVDQKYKSIYALFDANEPGRSQPWKFRAFCIPGEGHGKLLASYFNPLPQPAQYFHSTPELLYDPDAPLHPDYTHILTQNRHRLPQELLDQVSRLDSAIAMRYLTMHLDEAIDVAKKRARWNYKTAIPHYFPSFKRLEFLLPLCLLQDNRVDVALSVQKMETGYLANTILPLDWAYKSARLVCRPDSEWLAVDKIEEGREGVEAADQE